MIRRKEEIRVREIEHAQQGKGNIYFHDWLLPEEAAGHGRVFSKVVIPVGSSIGYHQHKGEFEAFYVAEGEGTLRDGDVTTVIHAGDMNLCKNGDFHGIENTGTQDLVLMALIMNA
jgi:quercetin dioxygenase-like cupin family protein